MQASVVRRDGIRAQTISLLLFVSLLFPSLTFSATRDSFSGTTTVGQLSVAPTSISFGNVLVGTSQTQSVVLTNSGGSDLTITQATVNNSAFRLSGLAYPITLGSGLPLRHYPWSLTRRLLTGTNAAPALPLPV